MTSSRALELVHKLELPDDVGIQLNVVNALGDCPIAKADIIAILKDYARMAEELRNRISIAVSTFADIADYCKETRNLDSDFKTRALNLVRQMAERTIKAINEWKGTK